MADQTYNKPNPDRGFPIEAYDLTGTNPPTFAEGVVPLGWNPVTLDYYKFKVDTLGQLYIANPGSGGSGGGGVIQVIGTDGSATNVGYDAGTSTSIPISGSFSATVSTATVVQATATNLNAQVVGTVTTVPSGTQPISGTVTAVESGTWAVTVSGTTTTAPTGTQTIAGTVTNVQSGTATDVELLYVQGTNGTWSAVGTGGNAVPITGTIVGTVAVTQVTSPWVVGGTTTTVPSGTQSIAGSVTVGGTVTNVPSGTQSVAQTGSPWGVSGTVTAVESGTWVVTVAGTVTTAPSGTVGNQVWGSGTAGTWTNVGYGTTTISGTATANLNMPVAIEAGTVAVSSVSGTTTIAGAITGTVTTVPSGTQTVTGAVTGTITTVPSGTQTISGAVTVTGTVTSIPSGTTQAVVNPTTTNTIPSVYTNLAIAATGTAIKSSAGALYGYYIFNIGTAVSFVKLYNTNTAPTSTNTPIVTLGIPAGGAANVNFEYGMPFPLGIGIFCSGSAAGTDTTAPSGAVTANIYYA